MSINSILVHILSLNRFRCVPPIACFKRKSTQWPWVKLDEFILNLTFSINHLNIPWPILDGHADGVYRAYVGAYVRLLHVCADASGSH